MDDIHNADFEAEVARIAANLVEMPTHVIRGLRAHERRREGTTNMALIYACSRELGYRETRANCDEREHILLSVEMYSQTKKGRPVKFT